MNYSPEQLREWAEELERTGTCYCGPPAENLRAHADALERIAKLEECVREMIVQFDHGHELPEIVKARELVK